jgi:hypothetical protein
MYVCVCMCVRMYVCVCMCVYVCVYACMYVYVCMHVCMFMYVCMYACMYVCMVNTNSIQSSSLSPSLDAYIHTVTVLSECLESSNRSIPLFC